MRRLLLLSVALLLLFVVAVPNSYCQGSKNGPDASTLRDPDLEKDSLHNLEVARNYFRLKKAYVAALRRCEEIIAGNPTFAKIEEVLYIAGKSSLELSEKKGKQDPSLYHKDYTPEQFRELGRDYLTRLVTDYPDSSFRRQAEDELKVLGPKPKEDVGSKPVLKSN
jgi:outer membrane protein assembly factor BamD (BamD/ComL family)